MSDSPYSPPGVQDDYVSEGAVSVQVSQAWIRRINSPLYMLVAALTGVAITFVPMSLLALGIHNDWNVLTVTAAAACFLTVYLVPMFYMAIANIVVRQVHRNSPSCIAAVTQHDTSPGDDKSA